MNGRLTPWAPSVLIPTGLVVAMGLASSVGFRGVFPDWGFVTAAAVGAVGAALAMWLASWARLRVAEALALSLVLFVLLGAVAAEGVPTPGAFATFFDGLVGGWSKLLSSSPPADLTADFRVLPFTISWMGTMVGLEILRSSRIPGLAAVGPVAAMVLSLLVTLEDRTVALAQGGFMVAAAVLLGWVQQRLAPKSDTDHEEAAPGGGRRAGTLSAVGAVVVVGLLAMLLGPRMPLASANERFDLRQYQEPPFDPLREPSPLVQVKASLREEGKDRVVFRVTSDQQLDRFPLAIHSDYDGVVWSVADRDGDAAAEFRPVDSRFPLPADGVVDGWQTVQAEFEIAELQIGEFTPVWLPTAGWPVEIDSGTPLDVRFNDRTGTVAVPPFGAPEELVYELIAAIPPDWVSPEVRSASMTESNDDSSLPPEIRPFADDVLEGADKGWAQVEQIRATLVANGFYDAREVQATARPGHSIYRLSEFMADPQYIVGFEEQYAASAALIARSAKVPVRVVVGYLIPPEDLATRWSSGTLEVTAGDISAWIEVRLDSVGWIPVDVTPPRDRAPEERNTGVSEREVAIPNPPPPPPPPDPPARFEEEEEVEEEEAQADEETDEEPAGAGVSIGAIAVGAAVLSPLLAIVAFVVAVIVAKRRRTRRRRLASTASRRVAGAWYEFVDRCREVGAAPPRAATPQEFANGLIAADLVDEPDRQLVMSLASHVDHAAYHPLPADDSLADDAWACTDRVVANIVARRTVWQRLRSRLDPRPVLRSDPVAAAEENADG